MPRTTYLSKLLLTADDSIVALYQLTGVNHACNMRPVPGLQIPQVVASYIILILILVGIPFAGLVLEPKLLTKSP
ncbi:hypothetical protein V500_01805 [Pseudogymnoascus sp. VKM F-4518 (FW-2643)]|nr:hypothetical protein V500_01805 [Pseudogymnoascus sp. VKM F-4518 (FW-2643)]